MGLMPLDGDFKMQGALYTAYSLPNTWTWQKLGPDALKHPANLETSASEAQEAVWVFA